GDRSAVAHVGAAGPGYAAAGRGPGRHDRVRRDPVPRRARAVPRSLDRALNGPASGHAAAAAPPFLRLGTWIGGDRDGNPFVTARVTRQTAAIQADHVLRALENTTERIGRALTVHCGEPSAAPGIERAIAAAGLAHP